MQEKESAPEAIEKLFDAVGAMAELTSMYYNQLVEHDVPDGAAIQLTQVFICTVLAPSKGHD